MKQEIEVTANYTIQINAKYSGKELHDIVRRNLLRAFPNNDRILNKFEFKEEKEIALKKEVI